MIFISIVHYFGDNLPNTEWFSDFLSCSSISHRLLFEIHMWSTFPISSTRSIVWHVRRYTSFIFCLKLCARHVRELYSFHVHMFFGYYLFEMLIVFIYSCLLKPDDTLTGKKTVIWKRFFPTLHERLVDTNCQPIFETEVVCWLWIRANKPKEYSLIWGWVWTISPLIVRKVLVFIN